MNKSEFTFLDTDLQIHRLDPDPPVKEATQDVFDKNHPTAISAFSLVELKGNYIQDLILLHRKVAESDSFEKAYAKIKNTGGRRASLMFAQLISLLGGFEYKINPWDEGQRMLLTHLTAQITVAWEEFRKSVDCIFDDFQCTRATEEPDDDGYKFTATISNCSKENTKCSIVNFMRLYKKELEQLIDFLERLGSTLMTPELNKIKSVCKKTISSSTFPWEGRTCRQVGDLLIGLQSKSGRKLISSNYKEHQ